MFKEKFSISLLFLKPMDKLILLQEVGSRKEREPILDLEVREWSNHRAIAVNLTNDNSPFSFWPVPCINPIPSTYPCQYTME
jgi:hypothetical protein